MGVEEVHDTGHNNKLHKSDNEASTAAPATSAESIAVSSANSSGSAKITPLPLRNSPYTHRPKDRAVFMYSACVARPVPKSEARATPAA